MKLWIAAPLAAVFALYGCDKLTGKGDSGPNREIAELVTQLPGTDACKSEGKLNSLAAMKSEFTRLFGADNWAKWKSYSTSCDVVQRMDNPAVGPVLVLKREELYRNANTGNYAALIVSLKGGLQALCLSQETDLDGSGNTQWISARNGKRSLHQVQCKSGPSEILAAYNRSLRSTGPDNTKRPEQNAPANQSAAGTCSADDVRHTILELIKQKALLANVLFEASDAKVFALQEADGAKEAQISSSADRLKFDFAAMGNRAKLREEAMSQAEYSLDAIRTESVDPAVGSKVCNANLNARMPEDWGTALAEISYKIEKTSDGKDYITILGIDKR